MSIREIIRSEAAFLRKHQSGKGSFESFTSSDRRRMGLGERHRSFFVSPLILSALNSVLAEELDPVRNGLCSFLMSQRSSCWSFNYWERGSKDADQAPYPDDLDDTFCALAAISGHDPKAIAGGDLAMIVSLLTAVEDREGGPYRTWLVPDNAEKSWKDVDLAVNSNVAFFLSLNEISLESIDRLVEKAAKRSDFISPYYASRFSVIYFISRFYRGSAIGRIAEYLVSTQKRNGGWGNVLDTALAVSALANFNAETASSEKGTAYLLREKKSWRKPYPFVMELVKDGKAHYSGSPALTSAFVLEALWKQSASVKRAKTARRESERDERAHAKIIGLSRRMLDLSGSCLAARSESGLAKISRSHYSKQVTLLARGFFASLGKDGREKIRKGMPDRLGAANVLGWMAYSIYDDFYDGEGVLPDLPLANICLCRLGSLLIAEMGEYPGFRLIFDRIMSGIDRANGWEMDECRLVQDREFFVIPKRFPDFGKFEKLAERSMGHALGPIALLISAGYAPGSPEVRDLAAFFKHYIIAKQFNDDAHDYEEDILAGRLTPVTASVLGRWKKRFGKGKSRFRPEEEMGSMREIFWHETIAGAAEEILSQAGTARKFAKKLSSVNDQAFFEDLLSKEEMSARKALEEQRQSIDFIDSFKNGGLFKAK